MNAESGNLMTSPRRPLRVVVLEKTGQDARRCSHCAFCETAMDEALDMDITQETLLQLVILNDEEVLTSRTLWSERALEAARQACANSLNMEAVILALRDEARARGVYGA